MTYVVLAVVGGLLLVGASALLLLRQWSTRPRLMLDDPTEDE